MINGCMPVHCPEVKKHSYKIRSFNPNAHTTGAQGLREREREGEDKITISLSVVCGLRALEHLSTYIYCDDTLLPRLTKESSSEKSQWLASRTPFFFGRSGKRLGRTADCKNTRRTSLLRARR